MILVTALAADLSHPRNLIATDRELSIYISRIDYCVVQLFLWVKELLISNIYSKLSPLQFMQVIGFFKLQGPEMVKIFKS